MLKINKVVKDTMKAETNMFFQDIVKSIGHIRIDREVSVNELIAFYVKESAVCKMDAATDEIGNAYLCVATLLAFIERISTPFKKPTSFDEILKNKEFNTEDMIAECTGIFAKSLFEGNSKRADQSLIQMAVLVKKLIEEDYDDIPDGPPEPDEPEFFDSWTESEDQNDFETRANPNKPAISNPKNRILPPM